MSENQYDEHFADGIGEITLSGGMVRMDLFTITGKSEKEDRPEVRVNDRIIMPPEGFLRSFSAMEDLVKKLVDAGIIKKRDIDAGGDDPAVSTGNLGPEAPPKSPNF